MLYLIKIIFFLLISNSSFTHENKSNQILFKINNKVFTNIDLDERKEYVALINNFKPSEISELTELDGKKIRVGGMVKKDSISLTSDQLRFIISDFKNEIIVTYSGAVPNLFEEEKGVVAEGYLKDRNFLSATKILAKHDENYMPPEVKEALEEK